MRPYQTLPTENKFCPFCGKQNPITYRYCDECGHAIPKVSSPEPLRNSESRTNYSSPPVNERQNQSTIIIINSKKSVGVAILLTFFFGPLGLFYASISGGLMMILTPIVLFISLIVGGLNANPALIMSSLTLLIIGALFYWMISIIWAIVAVILHNTHIDRQLYEYGKHN